MALIDESVFRARGARGDTDSSYGLVMTTCCERVGVLDEARQDLYFNHENLGHVLRLEEGADCPFCEAPIWDLVSLVDEGHVPDHWRWACGGGPRPGSRRSP